MTNKTLIVGQIGCGAFAQAQDFPNFAKNPHTDVKWCCDLSPDRARHMADRFGIPMVTGDYMDVVNDPDVDLLKVCTSHDAHLPIIQAAAAKGKHIFCEKPMAMKEADAYAIIRAVRQGGVKLCVDLNRRMASSLHALRRQWLAHKANPRHQPWRHIETERELFPEEKHTQFLVRIQDESASYRLVHLDPTHGGGQIIGESVHWLDLACWLFAPQIPIEICAWGSTRLSHGINLTFSEGDTATILFHCGGTFDYPKELYEITHSGALFRNRCFVENEYFGIPDLKNETFPLQHDGTSDVGIEDGFVGYLQKYQAHVEASSNSADIVQPAVDKGHENMLASFVDAIMTDQPSPCDEMAGFVSMYLANLAIKSIELRQTLPVPIDKLTPCVV